MLSLAELGSLLFRKPSTRPSLPPAQLHAYLAVLVHTCARAPYLQMLPQSPSLRPLLAFAACMRQHDHAPSDRPLTIPPAKHIPASPPVLCARAHA